MKAGGFLFLEMSVNFIINESNIWISKAISKKYR